MWPQLSFVLSQITRLTDGQTDGQTDTFLVASSRWHFIQREKIIHTKVLLCDRLFKFSLSVSFGCIP